jgi:hypothetical protein
MTPKIEDGYTADITLGTHQLRLKSEMSVGGIVALVYDMTSNKEIEREFVNDFEAGKRRAEEIAKDYLSKPDASKLPLIKWEKNQPGKQHE